MTHYAKLTSPDSQMSEQSAAGLAFRKLQGRDWPRIMQVQQLTYPDALLESQPALQAKQAVSPDTCFVVDVQGQVEGYLLALPYQLGKSPSLNDDRDMAAIFDNLHIHDFCLSPACRGQGMGRRIIQGLLSSPVLNRFRTASVVSVMNSRYFWESFGFSDYCNPCTPNLSSYGQEASYLSLDLS
ncbi:GNAT family N-acetyltransferase [Bowmanella denitrificans]|uniref:GNAT family N-acetyltransferase n=1 Tax=Bowmanella denitrificans TaxID=366582 RepID=UPI000C9B3CF0|nr:GNAT family N-acetyltransferase [Bowmanella denitrificans]